MIFYAEPGGGEITVEVIPGVRVDSCTMLEYVPGGFYYVPATWIHPSGETHTETATQYTFTIDPYYYIGEEIRHQRTGGVMFSLGELEEGVWIYQNCADAPAIAASTKNVDLTYVEQAFTVDVSHNVDITYEISADGQSWLSCQSYASTSETTDKFVFSVTRYDGDDDRSTTITFTDRTNYATEIVKVTQHGLYGFSKIPEDMSTAFPDLNFRNFVLSKFDTDGDGILSGEEALAVTSMDARSHSIAKLDGIQYFANLENLDCSYNKLTDLKLSSNTKLITLRCVSNYLISLNVSGCAALEELTFIGIDDRSNFLTLTTIDISGTKLKNFGYSGYDLTSLVAIGCTELVSLNCSGNKLTFLDFSNCPALKTLRCHSNRLTSLDVSDCTALKILDCSWNNLISLDVSRCKELEILDCSFNSLTSLNVAGCSVLSSLKCYNNKLTSLNVTGCSSLTDLSCYKNQLTRLDVSSTNLGGRPGYYIIDCHDNPLETLYLKKGWDIIYITYSRNSDYIPDQTEIIFVD